MPGDVVLSVDGSTVDGLTVDDARGKIRGPKGTVVTLSVLRGTGPPISVRITRDIVQTQEVDSEVLAGGRSATKLSGFSDAGADEVVTALRAHRAADRTKLILDLRGNPGGYVTAARTVASQFIGSESCSGSRTPTQCRRRPMRSPAGCRSTRRSRSSS